MTGIIEIIEEQDGWLAVGKPAGLSVHNAEDGYNLLSILEEQLGCTLHAAHRLDQPTSGVMLIDKNPQSTQILQKSVMDSSTPVVEHCPQTKPMMAMSMYEYVECSIDIGG